MPVNKKLNANSNSMKILLLASSMTVFPSLHYLKQQDLLAGIICPDRNTADVFQIQEWAISVSIPVILVNQQTLYAEVSDMISKTGAKLVLAYTFPYKIPASLFELVRHGFYNVHYSLLPKYKGPAPIFWQLKNGDQQGGITIHQMNKHFDDGPIVCQLPVQILPGENEGLFNSRLSQLSVGLVKTFLECLSTPLKQAFNPQKEGSSYFSRPVAKDISINWENQTSIEIENLVNACNPYCNGAITLFRGQPVRLLEVNPTDPAAAAQAAPGTIVHADQQYGLFVMCADKNILRINIIQLNEGVFTGSKLSAIGVKAGDKFEDSPIPSLA